MKEDIIKILEKNRSKLKNFGVVKIALFGSYAKGLEKRGSDVDLLVTLKNNDFSVYCEVYNFLEKKIRRKVDLVLEKGLRAELEYIKEDAIYVKV